MDPERIVIVGGGFAGVAVAQNAERHLKPSVDIVVIELGTGVVPRLRLVPILRKMQIEMIGLGRMGTQMVKRLSNGGHRCVVFDKELAARNIHYLDGGISGGVWVSERGYAPGVSR